MAKKKLLKRAKQVVVKESSGGMFMTVQSRFKELNEAFKQFSYNSLDNESKMTINSALREAFKEAMKKMLPLDEQTFKKYGNKKRITTEANHRWGVGKSSGRTAKELSKIKPLISVAKSSGNPTLKYDIPFEIMNKFHPLEPVDYHFGRWDASKEIVPFLRRWIETKRIKSKNPNYSSHDFAWAIMNAWATNYPNSIWKTDRNEVVGRGGKPDLSTDRALRLTLNSSAREAFLKKLSDNLPNIVSTLTSEVINKTLK